MGKSYVLDDDDSSDDERFEKRIRGEPVEDGEEKDEVEVRI